MAIRQQYSLKQKLFNSDILQQMNIIPKSAHTQSSVRALRSIKVLCRCNVCHHLQSRKFYNSRVINSETIYLPRVEDTCDRCNVPVVNLTPLQSYVNPYSRKMVLVYTKDQGEVIYINVDPSRLNGKFRHNGRFCRYVEVNRDAVFERHYMASRSRYSLKVIDAYSL